MALDFEANASKIIALRNRALIQAATSKDVSTRQNYERLLLERRLASDVKEKEAELRNREKGRFDLIQLGANELEMLKNLPRAFLVNSPPRKQKRPTPSAVATIAAQLDTNAGQDQLPTQLPQATNQGYLPPPDTISNAEVRSAKRVHRSVPEFVPKLDY
ncbi:hypothetical protein OGAPHI_006994 [Ogataea philodendri]|uniref:Uncharacterized protein n=1 Tax=Ogataea philodendri TaxID=1378263 RepID=A0A9P8SZ63_9ASCO|nr:uncharacterized protein OGAPHI_006994 [Ogataea philodendri]KAH3660408.1 hypothetical protein OGAPHI_006994 [Ogataea philodendri]